MRCSACGADNPAGAKFCNSCGAAQAAACPQCGQRNPPASRFCNECGHPLAATPVQGPSSPSPERYTPKHLAEKILTSRGALEGERKQVTVLFADIKGSTELIEGLDPEQAQALLDGAVKAMMEAVHRYEGTVNQILGDGIMALFGAPVAHEDHAVRACYAALAMQEAIRKYSEQARHKHGVEVHARVGLNSGEVVVRSIANDLRMDYSAMGPTVHLAARMEQLAADDSIRLTAATFALAQGYIQVRVLGPIPVRGLAEPVEVYELVGTGAIRTRLQALSARGLTRFVGRQAELETIFRALDRAGQGQGQVVALVGEPGVGKSRLVWEITHSHRAQGWLVLESGSVSYGKATSYLPVIDLLKTYCRIESRDDARTIREKLTGKLLTLDRALEPSLPAFLALLDVPAEDPTWDALDPRQRRRQTLDALKRLVLRESREQPLLLVFEDLHWIDPETQALLDGLVESLPTARLLLLVNYRPEYAHAWGGKTYYTQLRIDPLPAESAEELLAALLGDHPSVRPLKPLLIERTEGTPLFLEESVRTLVETGALVGERGAYRLTGDLPSVRLPPTVQAVLAARIDRLQPEDKRLLQAAAVVGKDVPFAVLRAIADVPDEGLHDSLGRLQAAEFLYEASLFPELEYTFKHALTHEAAYGSVLQERRRALHVRIVEVIERLYPDRLAEHAERLAHHAIRGEAREQAVTYARLAGAKAQARSAYREALLWFEEALGALGRLPETRARRELALEIRLELRGPLNALGQNHRLLERLREAESLAEALGDQQRLGWVLTYAANCLYALGQPDPGITAAERAVAAAEVVGDPRLKITSHFQRAWNYLEQGEHRVQIDALRWCVAALDGDLYRDRCGNNSYPAATCRGTLARCMAGLGEFDEAEAWAEEGIRIAEELDHPFTLAWILSYAGGPVPLSRGWPDQAIAALERARGICEASEIRVMLPLAAGRLGAAYVLAGRVDDALPILEQALEIGPPGGEMAEGALRAVWLGEAYLEAGRLEDAALLAEQALEAALVRTARHHQVEALRLLGQLSARCEPSDLGQAEAYVRQALALAEELDLRPLEAHCRLDLGSLYRRTGRAEEARAELMRATASYRAMGMTFWLPEAEAELAEITTSLAATQDC